MDHSRSLAAAVIAGTLIWTLSQPSSAAESTTTWCASFPVERYKETKTNLVVTRLPDGYTPVGGGASSGPGGVRTEIVIACKTY